MVRLKVIRRKIADSKIGKKAKVLKEKAKNYPKYLKESKTLRKELARVWDDIRAGTAAGIERAYDGHNMGPLYNKRDLLTRQLNSIKKKYGYKLLDV